jgi:MFS superfamily sulfate permease-like transporter
VGDVLPLAVYALLGSSRHLSVGPGVHHGAADRDGGRAAAAGDPGRYAALAAIPGRRDGLLFLVARVVRLGFVADLFSKPILAGYLAGVALIMMIGQLGKTTGVPVDGDGITGS